MTEVLAGAGLAALGTGLAFAAMWASGWFHDEHRQLDVRREQLWLLAVPAVAGGVAGVAFGVLDGLAVLLALGGVLVGGVLGWGLAGGDGEPDTVVAGICGLGVALGAVAAVVVALRSGADPSPAQVAWMLLPAAFAVVGVAVSKGPGRAGAAALALLVYVVPPALLTVT